MLKLTDRLQMVAEMVRPGKMLADIGTDHAYLPVYLILNNVIPCAVAADLREGPLENARQTVEKYDIADKVKLVLSDGLKELEKTDCHDFTIAGMGGNLISDILANSPWVNENGNHFVLQPQSHAEDLREYLMSTGFRILRENVTKEGRHLYSAMEVVYTGRVDTFSEAYTYIGEIMNSECELKFEYLDSVIKRLEIKYNSIQKSENKDASPILQGELERIEKIMLQLSKLREVKNNEC